MPAAFAVEMPYAYLMAPCRRRHSPAEIARAKEPMLVEPEQTAAVLLGFACPAGKVHPVHSSMSPP